MRTLVQSLGHEDFLFSAAVMPAALAWILFESFFAGLFAWAFSYAAIAGGYEYYLAPKYNWPSSTVAKTAKELWETYRSR